MTKLAQDFKMNSFYMWIESPINKLKLNYQVHPKKQKIQRAKDFEQNLKLIKIHILSKNKNQ